MTQPQSPHNPGAESGALENPAAATQTTPLDAAAKSAEARREIQRREPIEVVLDADRLHVFDADSGQNLTVGGG